MPITACHSETGVSFTRTDLNEPSKFKNKTENGTPRLGPCLLI